MCTAFRLRLPVDWRVQTLADTPALDGISAVVGVAVAPAGAGVGAVFGLALAARCAAFFLRSIQRFRRCCFTRICNCCPISGVQYGKLADKRQAK